ncbi:MAG: SIS domain-containing protein [Hyphomicrobiales bacterium]
MPESFAGMAHRALAELGTVVDRMPEGAIAPLVEAILSAKRMVLHGLGREGLQMRGLAMRLFHMGLDVHVWGDMTMPPLSGGDLLVVSAGPGHLVTVEALMEVAKAAGAKTAIVTAEPGGPAPKRADVVLAIPAQTMASDQSGDLSILPMGSLFEMSQMLVFEMLVLKLRDRLGETAETMRRRHTNLE